MLCLDFEKGCRFSNSMYLRGNTLISHNRDKTEFTLYSNTFDLLMKQNTTTVENVQIGNHSAFLWKNDVWEVCETIYDKSTIIIEGCGQVIMVSKKPPIVYTVDSNVLRNGDCVVVLDSVDVIHTDVPMPAAEMVRKIVRNIDVLSRKLAIDPTLACFIKCTYIPKRMQARVAKAIWDARTIYSPLIKTVHIVNNHALGKSIMVINLV